MITAEKRLRIRQLAREGLSQREIAAQVGVSRQTVSTYVNNPERGLELRKRGNRESILSTVNQDTLRQAFIDARGNSDILARLFKTEPWRFGLASDFNLTPRSIRRYFVKNHGDLITPPSKHWQKFDGSPGKVLQIDFTFANYQFAGDDKLTKLCIFEAVYHWSHKGFVLICPDTKQASWLLGIATCLARFGVPQEILCDNDRSLVLAHPRDGKVRFHPDFEWFCEPLNLMPRACRPLRPESKGAVERWGGYVKTNGLQELSMPGKQCANVVDLQAALDKWTEEVADKRLFNGIPVEKLFEEESAYLVPVKDRSVLCIGAETMVVSSRGGIHLFGVRIPVSMRYANAAVTVVVRYNGEYLISSPRGDRLASGVIPRENLQTKHWHDRADSVPSGSFAPAGGAEEPASAIFQDLRRFIEGVK